MITDSIIFDVDGTLWDSTEVVARAWNEVLAEVPQLDCPITIQRLKSLFGRTLPDIAAVLFPTLSTAQQLELIDACCAREHELLLEVGAPLYPGWEQTLAALAARFPLFIVSNCQAGYIETFLQCTGLGRYITDHLCPGDTGEAKAANISAIVQRHRLQAPVYVGDTLGDYQAVKLSDPDMPFIFAAYGFGQVASPDYTIHTPSALIDLFAAR